MAGASNDNRNIVDIMQAEAPAQGPGRSEREDKFPSGLRSHLKWFLDSADAFNAPWRPPVRIRGERG